MGVHQMAAHTVDTRVHQVGTPDLDTTRHTTLVHLTFTPHWYTIGDASGRARDVGERRHNLVLDRATPFLQGRP